VEPERVRELVVLQGRVQGVGLRERVLQIARGYDVAGTVRNLRAGDAVEIDVEAEQSGIDAFLADLIADLPSFAVLDSIRREPAAPRGATGFRRLGTG
jgi:hydrogenase maturation factor HypF (carbamoyltransferase family)